MNSHWTIGDLIDFHFFTQLDEEVRRSGGEAALIKRDRRIYLAKIEPQLGKAEEVPHRMLVRKWLTLRRLQYRQEHAAEATPLPGAVWQEMALLCQVLVILLGLATGSGLAASLLLYAGTTPLNVAAYFGLFVILQVGMLGMQAVLLGYRRARRIPMESTVLYLLFGRVVLRGLDSLRRRLHSALTGRQRLDLAALAGGVHQRRELAALLIWPAFILVQLGGIGFNLGVLGATLTKVAFTDVAFAWQSSLQLSAQLVAGVVHWVALPWSWALPGTVPSLAQIEGSQLILKEGVSRLATGDLVAWWPFLCCAVLVYGLLPRCLLLALGLVQQRRTLEQLHFTTLAIRPLIQRMTAPRIDSNGEQDNGFAGAEAVRKKEPPLSSMAPSRETLGLTGGARWYLLVPEELDEDELRAALQDRLQPELGSVPACLPLGVPGENEPSWLTELAAATAEGTLAGILLLHEAWQPPLKETEEVVRSLRRVAGERTPLTILLIGRPAGENPLTPADPEQVLVWTKKMQALGDAWLDVRPLVRS